MPSSRRITFTRALRIAGYNWPLYAAAACVILAGVTVAALSIMPPWVRWFGGAGAAVAAWYSGASFGAFHWMFDRSELLRGDWLKEEIPQTPGRWVQINVGLEETTLPLSEVFPGSEGKQLDLFNPTVMTEPAVTRARQQHADAAAEVAQPDSLPVDERWADLVVVTLAAHEIRDAEKRACFFDELRRIVTPAGRVVVAEHLHDMAAVLAFGPGIFHFFPRGEWLRLGSRANLELVRERSITPFIRVFVFRRSHLLHDSPV